MSGTDHVNDLEHQIEQTRDELAQTVEALAHKADVPARAKEKAADALHDVEEKAADVLHDVEHKAEEAKYAAGAAVIRLDDTRAEKPWLLPAAGAAAGLAVAGAVIALVRRRRR